MKLQLQNEVLHVWRIMVRVQGASPELRHLICEETMELKRFWSEQLRDKQREELCSHSFLFMIKTKAQSKNCEVATGVAVAIALWSSSVVVHCRGDGHTPPDLPPSNQTDNEKSTQETQLLPKL